MHIFIHSSIIVFYIHNLVFITSVYWEKWYDYGKEYLKEGIWSSTDSPMQAIVFNKTSAAIVSGTVGYVGFSVGVSGALPKCDMVDQRSLIQVPFSRSITADKTQE